MRPSHILSSLLLAAATMAGHAAELGDAQVQSHIGQALVADVELTLVEEPGRKVEVRLAHPDVYRGANIAMPPVLSSLNLTVMRRDGRQFLHLTSLKPVEHRMLHVYLELVDGSQRSVRLVTLWLTPDPNPAPPPPPVPVPVPVAASKPVPVAHPAAALQAGEVYLDPVRPLAPPVRKPAPKAAPVFKAPHPKRALPVKVAAAPAEAPACAPRAANDEHLNACVALGEKNAALHQQLGKLEEKVKLLQGTTATVPPAAPAPVPVATPKEVAPKEVAPKELAPKGAPRIHRKPKKVEPPVEDTPWLALGGAIAAVLGIGALVLALLRRRRRSSLGKIPAAHKPAKLPGAEEGAPKPHFMAAVKARLMPGRGKEAAPEVAPEAAQQAE